MAKVQVMTAQPDIFSTEDPPGLRGFIDHLDRAGLLKRTTGLVDWKFEIGRRTREAKDPTLFEDVRGYPGQKVFTNGLRTSACFALALGLGPELPMLEIVAEAERRLAEPLRPTIIEESPVLENVREGDTLDLRSLPVPHWNERDAGRYIGTWHLNISKDPDSGVRNVGVYRMQLLGANQATVSTHPQSDLARHLAKAEQRDLPLPMAVAIGVPEVAVIAAAGAFPPSQDEYEIAGALGKAPLDLIRCRDIDLEVPAETEIVIEGFIHPHTRVQDGPYFDFTGMTNTNPAAFLFNATRLMFRNAPIFRGTSIGNPGAEDHQLFAFLAALNLVDFSGAELFRRRMFGAFQSLSKMQAMRGASTTC